MEGVAAGQNAEEAPVLVLVEADGARGAVEQAGGGIGEEGGDGRGRGTKERGGEFVARRRPLLLVVVVGPVLLLAGAFLGIIVLAGLLVKLLLIIVVVAGVKLVIELVLVLAVAVGLLLLRSREEDLLPALPHPLPPVHHLGQGLDLLHCEESRAAAGPPGRLDSVLVGGPDGILHAKAQARQAATQHQQAHAQEVKGTVRSPPSPGPVVRPGSVPIEQDAGSFSVRTIGRQDAIPEIGAAPVRHEEQSHPNSGERTMPPGLGCHLDQIRIAHPVVLDQNVPDGGGRAVPGGGGGGGGEGEGGGDPGLALVGAPAPEG